MVLERLVILSVLLVTALLLTALWRWWLRQRQQKLAKTTLPDVIAQSLPPGPALLYFTTENCVQCRLQQTPILNQLAQAGTVAVHQVDAVADDQLTRFFGIMTVPTTVWLDQQRRPAAINHGLASLAHLRQQARQVGAL
jgi:thioredoxin 1